MVAPHSWKECWPVIIDTTTGKVDLQSEANKTVRRIFSKLGQLDRIQFHQACCQNRMSPAHEATIIKIKKKLTDAGI